MIRQTLQRTKAATWCILLPEPKLNKLPWPCGTGFFVSGDGWFLTAAHVIADTSGTAARADVGSARLMSYDGIVAKRQPLHGVTVAFFDPRLDLAILKVDPSHPMNAASLSPQGTFQHLDVAARMLEEAEPVYSFGYPLSSITDYTQTATNVSLRPVLSPRVTSAIVASTVLNSSPDPNVSEVYVLDKPFNDGSSGGPIIATQTGKVHAICSRTQGTRILQSFNGQQIEIIVPSLYGVTTSLTDGRIQTTFRTVGIPLR